jgi:hypothetical protein
MAESMMADRLSGFVEASTLFHKQAYIDVQHHVAAAEDELGQLLATPMLRDRLQVARLVRHEPLELLHRGVGPNPRRVQSALPHANQQQLASDELAHVAAALRLQDLGLGRHARHDLVDLLDHALDRTIRQNERPRSLICPASIQESPKRGCIASLRVRPPLGAQVEDLGAARTPR